MRTFRVGGAVRDALLGLPVQDQDWVVVGATPEQMIEAGFLPVGKDFPVFLHPQTRQLFSYVEIESIERWDAIAKTPECQRWWKHMAEVMPSNPDNSPVALSLLIVRDQALLEKLLTLDDRDHDLVGIELLRPANRPVNDFANVIDPESERQLDTPQRGPGL